MCLSSGSSCGTSTRNRSKAGSAANCNHAEGEESEYEMPPMGVTLGRNTSLQKPRAGNRIKTKMKCCKFGSFLNRAGLPCYRLPVTMSNLPRVALSQRRTQVAAQVVVLPGYKREPPAGFPVRMSWLSLSCGQAISPAEACTFSSQFMQITNSSMYIVFWLGPLHPLIHMQLTTFS